MGRPVKVAKAETIDIGLDNPPGVSNTYGVVGGDTALTVPTVSCRVKIGANVEADGYIIRQKGSRKYLVTDGTNTGTCVLADLADGALTEDTMTITITNVDTTTSRLARMTTKFGIDFAGSKVVLTFNAANNPPAGTIFYVSKVESV